MPIGCSFLPTCRVPHVACHQHSQWLSIVRLHSSKYSPLSLPACNPLMQHWRVPTILCHHTAGLSIGKLHSKPHNHIRTCPRRMACSCQWPVPIWLCIIAVVAIHANLRSNYIFTNSMSTQGGLVCPLVGPTLDVPSPTAVASIVIWTQARTREGMPSR